MVVNGGENGCQPGPPSPPHPFSVALDDPQMAAYAARMGAWHGQVPPYPLEMMPHGEPPSLCQVVMSPLFPDGGYAYEMGRPPPWAMAAEDQPNPAAPHFERLFADFAARVEQQLACQSAELQAISKRQQEHHTEVLSKLSGSGWNRVPLSGKISRDAFSPAFMKTKKTIADGTDSRSSAVDPTSSLNSHISNCVSIVPAVARDFTAKFVTDQRDTVADVKPLALELPHSIEGSRKPSKNSKNSEEHSRGGGGPGEERMPTGNEGGSPNAAAADDAEISNPGAAAASPAAPDSSPQELSIPATQESPPGDQADVLSNDLEREWQAHMEEHADKAAHASHKPQGRSMGAAQSHERGGDDWVDGESMPGRWWRLYINFVSSTTFDNMIGVFILLNTLFMGMQADQIARASLPQPGAGLNEVAEDPEDNQTFSIMETVFCILFFGECVARLTVQKRRYFCAAWNWFDVMVVGAAVFEECLKYGVGGNTLFGSLSVFRIVRIMKITRTLRIIRVVRVFRELRIVVMAMVNCLRSLFWTLLLLFVLQYVMAILILMELTSDRAVQVHSELSESFAVSTYSEYRTKYFPNLVRCLLTLFQSVTGGLEWSQASLALEEVTPWIPVVWVLFMASVCFAIGNTVTGFFVDHAIKCAQDDARNVMLEESEEREVMIAEVRQSFYKVDTEGHGVITRSKLGVVLAQPKMARCLKRYDIDPKDVFTYFDIVCDADRTISLAEIDAFVRGCFRLKGVARSLDLVCLSYRQQSLARKHQRESQALAIAGPSMTAA
eukprot:TRINITY_DN111776_c0_g1_i1.p1 TRINITY_DN111776_c0_g1~~TRINITY_DN111776_c0_g1_i1.p1  ORF type:complete len:781 (-),score=144.87 TRINITY_DN111776_c0_g1_i1:141-2483(-)